MPSVKMPSQPSIPSFGYQAQDFKTSPFVFEMSRLGSPAGGPRGFAHRHTYFHILWLMQGTGTHIIDFEAFDLKPPSVFFISPHQVHLWSSETPVDGYSIKFSIDFFQRLMARSEALQSLPFGPIGCDPVLYLGEAETRDFKPLLQNLLDEGNIQDRWRQDMIAAMLQVILLRLCRLHPAPLQTNEANHYSAITRRFLKLLEVHFLTTKKVDEYARMLDVSSGFLNDALKRVRGRTALQLIAERLLLEAKRRLMFSDATIAEVGFELGFEDPAYFARFFRKGVQLSPGEFRRSHERFK